MTNGPSARRCTKGIWDDSIPGIFFDGDGASNYALIQERMMEDFPKGNKGQEDWDRVVESIKKDGHGKPYDCVIGVSGGTDSCYLLHVANEVGLRPLAVNLDNGWNSDIAVQNIKKVTSALDIDLETWVIDYEEMKDILRAYMKASLPWVDGPTDQAIGACLMRTASREGVKYVLTGTDFRSEGKQPSEWTHIDSLQLRYLHRRFGTVKLRSYPVDTVARTLYNRFVRKVRKVWPFNYIEYNKQDAQQFLMDTYGWTYYGGHHHENIFTKWVIGYWLPAKFGIDKRLITYSAQVLSGAMTRDEALAKIAEPPYPPERIEPDTEYILKKLDLSRADFDEIWNRENKYFPDYPSLFPLFEKYSRWVIPIASKLTTTKPKTFYEIEARKRSKDAPESQPS